jgi:hypothetical protein
MDRLRDLVAAFVVHVTAVVSVAVAFVAEAVELSRQIHDGSPWLQSGMHALIEYERPAPLSMD